MADTTRIDELRRRLQKDPASIAFAQLAEEYRRAGRYQDAVDTLPGRAEAPSRVPVGPGDAGTVAARAGRTRAAQQELERRAAGGAAEPGGDPRPGRDPPAPGGTARGAGPVSDGLRAGARTTRASTRSCVNSAGNWASGRPRPPARRRRVAGVQGAARPSGRPTQARLHDAEQPSASALFTAGGPRSKRWLVGHSRRTPQPSLRTASRDSPFVRSPPVSFGVSRADVRQSRTHA